MVRETAVTVTKTIEGTGVPTGFPRAQRAHQHTSLVNMKGPQRGRLGQGDSPTHHWKAAEVAAVVAPTDMSVLCTGRSPRSCTARGRPGVEPAGASPSSLQLRSRVRQPALRARHLRDIMPGPVTTVMRMGVVGMTGWERVGMRRWMQKW